jgi:hypothetical protein
MVLRLVDLWMRAASTDTGPEAWAGTSFDTLHMLIADIARPSNPAMAKCIYV